MAKTSFGTTDIYKVSVGDLYNITKISIGDKLVYTAGNTVTYHVDTSLVYTEDVDADESVLSPKSFSPTKADWEFVGWRQDTNANATVETNLTMGDNPITLYAVFRKTVTVTYYNPTVHTSVNYKYYNNSNSSNPKFTISPDSYSGWTFRGWTKSSSPDGDISYTSISNTEISENITLYQSFETTITLTLYNGSATATTQSGKAYGNGNTNIYPKFSVTAATISGWTFRGWSTSSTANASITYASISNLAFSSNATLYALYELTITLSYNNNGGTGTMSSSTNKRYYSSAGSYINPTFTLASNTFSRANYSFVRWRMGGTSGTAYNAGAQVTLTSNTTFYAEWQATSHTVTYIYNGSRTTRTVSYGSSVLSPGITPTLSGCTFLGWTNNQSSASPLSSLNMGNSDITLWAVWKAANKNITPAKNNAWIEGGYLYVGTPIDTLAFNETVDTSLYSGVYINSLQLTLVNNLFYGGSGYAAHIYVSDGTSYGLAYMQNNWTTTLSGTYNGIPYTRADSSNVVISGYSFTVNFTTNNNTSAKIYWRFQNITNDTAYRPQMITIVGTCYLVGRQFAR